MADQVVVVVVPEQARQTLAGQAMCQLQAHRRETTEVVDALPRQTDQAAAAADRLRLVLMPLRRIKQVMEEMGLQILSLALV